MRVFLRTPASRIKKINMGTGYTASLNVSCIKQHICRGCEAEFSYHLNLQVTETAATKEAAAASAHTAAVKALENDVDQHPCPHCGMMQPDMIAKSRRERYLSGMWIALIPLIVSMVLVWSDWITLSTSAMIASAGVVLGLGVSVSGACFNPNRDMMAGQQTGAEKVRLGELVMSKPGQASFFVEEFSPLNRGQSVGLILIGVSVVAAISPLILPLVKSWPMNDNCPAMVGPGDSTLL